MDAGTGLPVGGAIVVLNRGGQPLPPIRVGDSMAGGATPDAQPRLVTGADGQFSFRGLAKSTFGVAASKLGLLPGAYGMLRPEGSSQTIALDEGERRDDVTIRLFRYATIAGTVLDESGEPFAGVPVNARRRALVGGHRVLGPRTGVTATDDRGMYRLTGLTPGEYIVGIAATQASAPASGPSGSSGTYAGAGQRFNFNFILASSAGPLGATVDAAGRLLAYPTMYYPGSRTTAQATPIVVGSGEERLSVDMVLSPVPTANISGRLVSPDGQSDGYQLRLTASDTGATASDPDAGITTTDTDGSFVFLAVPAGQYVLQTTRTIRLAATVLGGGAGAAPSTPQFTTLGRMLWAAEPVTIGAEDIRDLTVPVQQGLTVSGRLEFDGGMPPGDRDLRVFGGIDPIETRSRTTGSFSVLGAQRQFASTGLPPGKYIVNVVGVPAGWTLKSVMDAGIDISDAPFELTDRDLTNVVITLTDRASTISGVVRGPQGDVDDAGVVIAFPTDARLWQDYGSNPRRLKTARTSPKGVYSRAQPPGRRLQRDRDQRRIRE